MPPPLVRVVVVNYNGGSLTERCLRSVLASDWPNERLELVLVDNASSDGLADRLEASQCRVRVIRSDENLGFAGGCNLGLADLDDVDFVALVNNDAVVEPDWLSVLIAALEQDPTIGAASPRILLDTAFAALELRTTTSRRRGDRRDLGVQLCGTQVGNTDVTDRSRFTTGSWGPEPTGAGTAWWTAGQARVLVPTTVERRPIRLQLRADSARELTVTCGATTTVLRIGTTPTWFEVPGSETAATVDVINSAGVRLRSDLYAEDRGWLEQDEGRWRAPAEVFAWSGAAVVLRVAMLEEIGLFDERLFMYYEDLDLSWRGRMAGWRHVYEPGAVVRHRHAAAAGTGSALAHYFIERNRLVVLTKHAPARAVMGGVATMLAVTGSYALRDIIGPMLRLRRPVLTVVSRRLRAFAGFLRLLPSTLARRRAASADDLRGWVGLDP